MAPARFLGRYFEPEQYALWYWTFGLASAGLLGRAWQEWTVFGTQWCQWDFMFLSGVATFVLTGLYGNAQERRFHTMLRDTHTSGVLVSDQSADALAAALDRYVKRVAQVSCAFVFILMLLTLLSATLYDVIADGSASAGCYSSKLLTSAAWRAANPDCVANLAGMLAVMTGCGALAGIRLGRAAGYGMALLRLQQLGVRLAPLPGHSDGRSGLQPFAQFLTSQALLTLPAVLWVFVWWLIIPAWGQGEGCPQGRYDHWSDPFIGVWIAAIGFLWLAFLSPLWHLHRWMAAIQREEFEPLLHEIELQIADRHRLERAETDLEARDRLLREIADLSNRHYTVRHIDTWVIAPGVLHRLIMSYTITVFWPLVYQVAISGQDAPKGAAEALASLVRKMLGE